MVHWPSHGPAQNRSRKTLLAIAAFIGSARELPDGPEPEVQCDDRSQCQATAPTHSS